MAFILDKNDYLNKFIQSNSDNTPLKDGVPLIDISDKDIMEIYYFRWYTYFEHIKNTPDGYVVTEFLPSVPWSKKYNTINCPLGHHLYEGRWIHNTKIIEDYIKFWFSGGEPRYYSTWFADAVLSFVKLSGNQELLAELYDNLKENYYGWEKEHKKENGLFYSICGYDGMEFSISGDGFRPTLNSYMYGDLKALAEMAKILGLNDDSVLFSKMAEELKKKIDSLMWDNDSGFYEVLSEENNYQKADVLELVGFIPWYFSMPDGDKACAWKYLNDKDCFYGKYGPTTAQRSHKRFMEDHDHECLWNGPSWPFATSQTLVGMANLLNDYSQEVISKADYFNLLKTYAFSQHLTEEDGTVEPFIDENLHPDTGEWIARRILRERDINSFHATRGEKYNHSSFCDLVLSGLVGIRADINNTLTVNPLFSENQLDYLCADNILYHAKIITVVWDKTGDRYKKGKGLSVFVNGKLKARSEEIKQIYIDL